MKLLIFILATIGLTGILVRSTLFKPLREKITIWYNSEHRLRSINKKRRVVKYQTSWVFNSIFGCGMCMGVWASVLVYYSQKYLPEVICYALIGSICSAVVISCLTLIEKK